MEKHLFFVGASANMEPTLLSGDEIACIKTDFEQLKYYGGCIHYIKFTDGTITIKRAIDQGDSVLIKADATGIKQAIPKKYIKELYRVIASARLYE